MFHGAQGNAIGRGDLPGAPQPAQRRLAQHRRRVHRQCRQGLQSQLHQALGRSDGRNATPSTFPPRATPAPYRSNNRSEFRRETSARSKSAGAAAGIALAATACPTSRSQLQREDRQTYKRTDSARASASRFLAAKRIERDSDDLPWRRWVREPCRLLLAAGCWSLAACAGSAGRFQSRDPPDPVGQLLCLPWTRRAPSARQICGSTRAKARLPISAGTRLCAAGKPDESELVRRISSSDADEVMPPAESGKKLTAAADRAGAPLGCRRGRWQKHWAYTRPARPPIPRPAAAHNPIDFFVRAKLVGAGALARRPRPIASRSCAGCRST